MDFKNPERHLAFKLFILILLFGFCQLFLIVNYLYLPEINPIERSRIYRNAQDVNIVQKDNDYFNINLFDHKITGLENIIIFIFMLWGFMRLIDLMFFLEKYKKV